ncbi:MAG: SRPBCC family protein [Pseudonocardiales bacterium]|nr:SRPBCC family protein [Pseudonocardiales bacterium]
MAQMVQGKAFKDQATINAPAERIFAALADIEARMRFFPGVNVTGCDGDVVVIDYVVNPIGVNVPVTFRAMRVSIVDAQEPTVLTWVADGPIKGTARWNLQSQGESKSTLVTLNINYQMSTDSINSALGGGTGGVGGVVGGVTTNLNEVISPLSSAISSHFQREIENLKRITES